VNFTFSWGVAQHEEKKLEEEEENNMTRGLKIFVHSNEYS
jgi:hypothetical protein